MALNPSLLGGLGGLGAPGGAGGLGALGALGAPGGAGGLGALGGLGIPGLGGGTLSLMMPAGGLTNGPLLGAPAPGTNKFNPLQGQSAVSGIGDFVNTLMTTNTLRKLGILPGGKSSQQGGAAANPLSGLLGGLLGGAAGGGGANPLSALTSLLGGAAGGAGGGDPLSAITGLLGMLGGGALPGMGPLTAPAAAAAAADFARLPSDGLIA